MSSEYRSYAPNQETVDVVFERSAAVIQDLREILRKNSENNGHLKLYSDFTSESMAEMVFGSNMVERAGLDHKETIKWCLRVFAGEAINAATVPARDENEENNLRFLREQRGIKDADENHVIRSRREIIQHAQAFKYIVDAALNRDRPLPEELILETHKILTEGIPIKGESTENYAGRYRKTIAKAGHTIFTAPQNVPAEMQRLLTDFNEDVKGREESGELDPWYLAADIAQDFVTIHPFEDGNGRMYRLIANAYLIKYAGFVVTIGEHDGERKQYL